MRRYVALHTLMLFITSIFSIKLCTYDGTLYVSFIQETIASRLNLSLRDCAFNQLSRVISTLCFII